MKHNYQVGDRAILTRSPFNKEENKRRYPAGTEVEITSVVMKEEHYVLAVLHGLDPDDSWCYWRVPGEKQDFLIDPATGLKPIE